MAHFHNHTRRDFLGFLGRGIAAGAALQIGWLPEAYADRKIKTYSFSPIKATDQDALVLADGFRDELLVGWEDKINASGELFGYNNDYIGFIQNPLNRNAAFLWVNHESPHPVFCAKGKAQSRETIINEMKSVGGSLLRLQNRNGKWSVVKNHPANKRFDATTPIPFSDGAFIDGSNVAPGTLGNCGGGITPWGSFLTCEENYEDFYGEKTRENLDRSKAKYSWDKYFDHSPQHFGWVTEINPQDGTAKKLVPLGRFAHEAAYVTSLPDGRVVVYMADDANDQHVYKFISSKAKSLEAGSLYVADTEKGQWLHLSYEKNEKLKKAFKSQTEVLIHTREAAKILGATPLDRPEDMARDPLTGAMVVALTNNVPKGRHHGSLFKIMEDQNNPASLTFNSSTLLLGGETTGFSCPDNLEFDRNGNLWMCIDISGKEMNKGAYAKFKNNGLFVIPAKGAEAGKVLQVGSAPRDAEFTGLCFSDDQKTLFLSVQHPGETTKDFANPTSHWPHGNGKTPRPFVVTISGPGLLSFTA